MFSLIAACDKKYGIGKNNTMAWYYDEDTKFFKKMTDGNVVIMGYNTWLSIPKTVKPLSNRMNVVITTKKMLNDDKQPDMIFNSIMDCVKYFSKESFKYKKYKKFVIGGASIYKQFLEKRLIYEAYITYINKIYNCDTFVPEISNLGKYDIYQISKTSLLEFRKYDIKNKEEDNMLKLLSDVLEKGVVKKDRTGTGTKSLFSRELRFDISNWNIPMMTTRPVSFKIIFEELMWILRGQTDNKILNNKKIKIWNDNTSREFLDKQGLYHYKEGDIGPSYGFQMRHYGEEYKGCDYEYNGYDQLEYVIDLIKNNPDSRRILINLWNPVQKKEMSLPPCVYGYQFYVSEGKLSCKIIQRSSDISLAGSHNCASGALFTMMLCKITNLKPGEIIWSPSDIHIYLNQIESVKEQLKRTPRPFPFINIKKNHKKITDFEFSDFELIGYNPYPKIHFAMNA